MLHKNKQYFENNEWTVEKAGEEIKAGLELLAKVNNKIVTFFGSHLLTEESKYYKHCKKTAFELGKKGYAIASGGGPGIMHAANSGATEANAPSIGFNAELLEEEKVTDQIFSHEMSFHFIFTRRFIMSIKSDALIFYPGGYGTLNELFEYAVLMQTNIVDKVPIICVNKEYWKGLFEWIESKPWKQEFLTHDARDLKLFHFVDTIKELVRIIENKES